MKKSLALGLVTASAFLAQPHQVRSAPVVQTTTEVEFPGLAISVPDSYSTFFDQIPELPEENIFLYSRECIREEEMDVSINFRRTPGSNHNNWNKRLWNNPFTAQNNYAQGQMHRYRGNRHNH